MIKITGELVELGLMDGKVGACLRVDGALVEITGLTMDHCVQLKDFYGEPVTIEVKGGEL